MITMDRQSWDAFKIYFSYAIEFVSARLGHAHEKYWNWIWYKVQLHNAIKCNRRDYEQKRYTTLMKWWNQAQYFNYFAMREFFKCFMDGYKKVYLLARSRHFLQSFLFEPFLERDILLQWIIKLDYILKWNLQIT